MTLDFLYDIAEFEALDAHFGRFIAQSESMAQAEVHMTAVAAALAHRAISQGDICCDLHDYAAKPLLNAQGESVFMCPGYEEWLEVLQKSAAFGGPNGEYPLVVDDYGYVYLYQYYRYQLKVLNFILSHTQLNLKFNFNAAAEIIKRLFKQYNPKLNFNDPGQRQMLAALNAAVNPFCVISGGPGTGKTTTIARILALLLELGLVNPGRILLAAPTGKAAARLGEAIAQAKTQLATSKTVLGAIPEEAFTIHRMLALIPHINAPGVFTENLKLEADLVVVDEASMADIELLTRLLNVLPPNCRLILAGDHAQLASVGAGSVLSDICGDISRDTAFSPNYANVLQTVYGGDYGEIARLPDTLEIAQPGDSLVFLTKNYRFKDGEQGLSLLTPLIRRGRGRDAVALLKNPAQPNINLNAGVGHTQIVKALMPFVTRFYAPVAKAGNIEEAFSRFEEFRILCALKESYFGAQNLNAACERILRDKGLIGEGAYYHGMPVIIGKNDYRLRLFNGDIGLVWRDDADGMLKVYFRDYQQGQPRAFSYYSLPEHDKAYAMTVHRSQGSEFDQVLLVLPDKDNRILTRELVYTGVSRAKSGVTVWSGEKVLATAIERLMERKSGLRRALKVESGAVARHAEGVLA